MLTYRHKPVAILKIQAVNDKQGNPRKAYIVKDLETQETLLITENEGAIKDMLPRFDKPDFSVNVEVKEFLRVINATRYL